MAPISLNACDPRNTQTLGIVTSVGGVNNSVFIQSYGDISAQLSGLGDGVACYVRVGDTGYLGGAVNRRNGRHCGVDGRGWDRSPILRRSLQHHREAAQVTQFQSKDWPVSPLDPKYRRYACFRRIQLQSCPRRWWWERKRSFSKQPAKLGTPPNNKSVYVWNGSVFVPAPIDAKRHWARFLRFSFWRADG